MKVGLFSVGGGLATLPFLYRIADNFPSWYTRETLVDMIAISQSTPGPIGINMATYAGYSAGGIPGGILATFALVTPSFFIMLFVVRVLGKFKENRFVKAAFYGIRPAVAALIASSACGIIKITLLDIPSWRESGNIANLFDYKEILLFAAIFIAMNKLKFHPAFYILIAAIIGGIFEF